MSVLVALKMDGRLAGAILTVLSLAGRDDGRKMSRFGRSRVGYNFLGPSELQANLCDFGTQIQFCGEPRQGCAIDDEKAERAVTSCSVSVETSSRRFAASGA